MWQSNRVPNLGISCSCLAYAGSALMLSSSTLLAVPALEKAQATVLFGLRCICIVLKPLLAAGALHGRIARRVGVIASVLGPTLACLICSPKKSYVAIKSDAQRNVRKGSLHQQRLPRLARTLAVDNHRQMNSVIRQTTATEPRKYIKLLFSLPAAACPAAAKHLALLHPCLC